MSARCDRPAFGAGYCELDKGHDGPHRDTAPSGRQFEWTDEATEREIQKWGTRGT